MGAWISRAKKKRGGECLHGEAILNEQRIHIYTMYIYTVLLAMK